MSEYYQQLEEAVNSRLEKFEIKSNVALAELTIHVKREDILEVCSILRDDEKLHFDTLIDVCGIDYSGYEGKELHQARFASVYHLQSVALNHRVRVISYLDDEMPVIASVVNIWASANWFEREAFDMFGILYDGHPDLRRILTDYGFIGYPLRKDFPMVGNVEMRYDEEKKRVVYEPVSIENRVIVPRTLIDDNRYEGHR